MPCPASCSTPKNASLKNRGLYRVVIRQSPGPKPEQNGCDGGVEPAGLEVEPDRGRRGLREHLLPVDRVLALEDRRIGLLAGVA